MRTLLVLIALLPLLPAQAGEQPKSADLLLNELQALMQNPDSSWEERWDAYKQAKAAVDKEKKKNKESKSAKRYEALRPAVAKALRRTELPASGWVMGFFGASLLWGGFAVCVAIAIKAGKGRGTSE